MATATTGLGSSRARSDESLAGLPHGRAFLAAAAIAVALSFTGIFDHSLWVPDEPRVADIGRAMFESGDYVVPTLRGTPFVEKPPLAWWVMAGLFRLFGVSAGVARSSSALAGVLALLLVYDVARRLSTPLGGVFAVLAAGTTSAFYSPFHRIYVDPWLAFAVMLGYWGVVLAAFPRKDEAAASAPRPSALAILTIYVAGGLAFLAKGPIGPGLVAGPALIAIVAGRRWGFFRSWAHVPGVLLLAGMCALWPAMLYQRGGKALLDGFLVNNVVDRFKSAATESTHSGHKHPMYYYLLKVPQVTLPWLLVLPAVAHWLWHRRHPATWNRPALLFMASVFPVGVLLLSVPGTKRQLYLLPLVAPLGVVVGAWLAATTAGERAHRVDRGSLAVLLGAAGLALGGLVAIVVALCFGSAGLLERVHIYVQMRPPLPVVVVLLAGTVAVVVGLAARALLLWRRRSPKAGPAGAGVVLALFLLGGPLLFVVSDSYNTFRPCVTDPEVLDGAGRQLAGYKLGEATISVLAFETGAVPKLTDDRATLGRWVQDGDVDRVLVERRHLADLPADVFARLRLVREWRRDKNDTWLLFRVAPVASASVTWTDFLPAVIR